MKQFVKQSQEESIGADIQELANHHIKKKELVTEEIEIKEG